MAELVASLAQMAGSVVAAVEMAQIWAQVSTRSLMVPVALVGRNYGPHPILFGSGVACRHGDIGRKVMAPASDKPQNQTMPGRKPWLAALLEQ